MLSEVLSEFSQSILSLLCNLCISVTFDMAVRHACFKGKGKHLILQTAAWLNNFQHLPAFTLIFTALVICFSNQANFRHIFFGVGHLKSVVKSGAKFYRPSSYHSI